MRLVVRRTSGSNGPSVADYDNDGDFDLFVAGYGGNFLYRNDGRRHVHGSRRADERGRGRAGDAVAWGDFDNDGRIDLYVSSYIDKPINEHDFLFHNEGGRFTDVLPEHMAKRGATHGIQWVDFDKDGDLDFSVANNNPNGTHSLYRNLLPPERARQSIQVLVQDARGRAMNAGSRGARVRGWHTQASRRGLVDTGGGYASQNMIPVHVGLGTDAAVDVEVTTLGKSGRKVTKIPKVRPGTIPDAYWS